MQIQNLAAARGIEAVIHGNNNPFVRVHDEYVAALARYGLEQAVVGDSPLVIQPGVTVTLSGAAPCELFSWKLETRNVDQFKNWIGIPDQLILEGQYIAPNELPEGLCSPALAGPREALTDAQWTDVQRAANYYLFGNSAVVSEYRQAITRHFAPFQAVVYAAARLEILPGATVRVNGYPAALIFRELVIHHGGAIKLHTPARMLVQHLLTLEA